MRSVDPRSAGPGGARSAGFTLLELLIVIVIAAVLAGLVAPGMQARRARGLIDSADRIALLINQAQQDAVLSSRIWQIAIDTHGGRLEFRRQALDGAFEAVSDAPFAALHADPDIRWSDLRINGGDPAAAGTVNLYPTGEQDGLQLSLAADGLLRRVVMDPIGPARVQAP